MPESVIERNINQDTINSLKNLITAKIETLKSLDKQIREANEVINGALLDKPAYQQANEKTKEATKARSQVRAQIMDTPEMKNFASKRKDFKDLRAQVKAELSDHLLDYERLSGANVIQTLSGEQLEIFKTATVTKAK